MANVKELFRDFDAVSYEQWKKKVINDLRGKPYDSLIVSSNDGFSKAPIYTNQDIEALEIPEKSNGQWQIRQDFSVNDIHIINQQIRDATENGVEAIGLRISKPINAEDFAVLFNGINLRHVSLHFVCGELCYEVFDAFYRFTDQQNIDRTIVSGSFDLDPLCGGESPDFENLAQLLNIISVKLPFFKILTIHSQPVHMENKTGTDELVSLLKKQNQYLVGLSQQGINPEKFAASVQFSVPVGTDYFMEIAKIRALRWLWNEWQNKHGIENPIPAVIQAQKSWKYNNPNDPYLNLLLHTTEAMAAVIGGCDILNLRSTDQTEVFNNDFFERISRNIQLILKYESNFDKVSDPVKGSYYIEYLTKNLVDKVL